MKAYRRLDGILARIPYIGITWKYIVVSGFSGSTSHTSNRALSVHDDKKEYSSYFKLSLDCHFLDYLPILEGRSKESCDQQDMQYTGEKLEIIMHF
jgi:hypothetical protein